MTPALRLENFWQTRKQFRVTTGGTAEDFDPPPQNTVFSSAIIPALSVAVDLHEKTSLYGGVHRGWQPPRTTDMVTTGGKDLNLGPRDSWNCELGVRTAAKDWLRVEVTGFLNDFSRQVIVPSESAGIVAANPARDIEGGEARYGGAEVGATWDAAKMSKSSFELPLTLALTWVPLAEFGPRWTPGYQGQRAPYAPEFTGLVRAAFLHPGGLLVSFSGQLIGSQLADPENTEAPTPDGLRGRLPAYTTLDGQISYAIPSTGLEVYLAGKNLTNRVYIGDRRPRGIQPAGFAQYLLGLQSRLAL